MTDGSLAERLQWILKNRQFETPTDLARRAGVAPNYIGLLLSGERGKRGLRTETAEKIARAASVRTEWLILGTGDPTSDGPAEASAPAGPPLSRPAGTAPAYPKLEQALVLLAKIIHPNALKALRYEDYGHDLTLQEWIARGHELDRMTLQAEREAEEARKKGG